MDQNLTICTACRHMGTACQPGYALIARLKSAIAAAGNTVAEDFEISGVATLTGCGRTCTLAYHGTAQATHMFGDVDPDTDIQDLLEIAQNPALHRTAPCDLDQLSAVTKLGHPPAAIMAMTADERLVC